MVTWTDVTLVPYPGGDTDYPEKVNLLIGHNEDLANEIEAARYYYPTLLDHINDTLAKNPLENNIDGNENYFKCINMLDGTELSQDYATVNQLNILFEVKAVDDLPPCTPPAISGVGLCIPNAQLRVASITDFGIFDYQAIALTNVSSSDHWYPEAFNKTYFLDLDTALVRPVHIKLDKPSTTVPNPILGDRIRIIMQNPNSTDSIESSDDTIEGLTVPITFGADYTFAVYDLVYASPSRGWHFTNVVLGAIV